MIDEAQLSERQRQILNLSALGKTDKEIARQIGVSEGTLRTYWERLRDRLNARSRTEVVALIYQQRYDRLNARYEELQATLNRMSGFVWTAQPSGVVDYCNAWFGEFGGLQPSQCLGPGCRALMVEEELEDSARRWRQAQITGQPYEARVRFRRLDDTFHLHQIRLFPLQSHTGEVYKWVGNAHALLM